MANPEVQGYIEKKHVLKREIHVSKREILGGLIMAVGLTTVVTAVLDYYPTSIFDNIKIDDRLDREKLDELGIIFGGSVMIAGEVLSFVKPKENKKK